MIFWSKPLMRITLQWSWFYNIILWRVRSSDTKIADCDKIWFLFHVIDDKWKNYLMYFTKNCFRMFVN